MHIPVDASSGLHSGQLHYMCTQFPVHRVVYMYLLYLYMYVQLVYKQCYIYMYRLDWFPSESSATPNFLCWPMKKGQLILCTITFMSVLHIHMYMYVMCCNEARCQCMIVYQLMNKFLLQINTSSNGHVLYVKVYTLCVLSVHLAYSLLIVKCVVVYCSFLLCLSIVRQCVDQFLVIPLNTCTNHTHMHVHTHVHCSFIH